MRDAVHSGSVDRGVLLGLSTGEEGHTGHSGRHSAVERLYSRVRNVLRRVLLGALETGRDHVGLEQCAFEEDVVVAERLVDGREHLLGDALACLQVVLAVRKDLWLDDWNYAILLSDKKIFKFVKNS